MVETIVLFAALSAANIGIFSFLSSDKKAQEMNEIAISTEEEKKNRKASLLDIFDE